MRFVAYRENGCRGLAVVVDGDLRGLGEGESPELAGGLDALVSAGGEALRDAADLIGRRGRVLDEKAIEILPPLERPSKIICIGLNYRDHSAEAGFEQPAYPTVFARFASSLIGAGATVVRPHVSTQLDYEGELAAIIGKGGRRISREDALEHIAGYAVFNDLSVRDYQFRSPQWTVGKNFDATGAFGPQFVTADELPAGCKGLRLETRLNGEVVQSASTDDMVFDVAELVFILSEAMTLAPGDVIVTGTPSGVGFSRNPPLFLRAGDVIEVEVGEVGLLRNTVVDEVSSSRAEKSSR